MALNILGSNYYTTINYARTMPPMVIPNSYYRLLDYLESSNSTGFRLLILPHQAYVTYEWYPYWYNLIAGSVASQFSPLSVINVGTQTNPIVETIIGNLTNGLIKPAAKLMGAISVKYILVSKDLQSNSYQGAYSEVTPSKYIALLDSAPDVFIPVMNTPEFNLYELNSALLMPRVFATNNSVPLIMHVNVPVFDGKSTYITVNASTSLSLTNSGSVFAWIYLKKANPSGEIAVNPTVLCFGPNRTFRLYVDGASHNLSIALFDGKTVMDSDFKIDTGIWYFVGFTVSESTVTIYINGNPILSKDYSSFTQTVGLYIGHDGTTSFFDGYISNVQIYRKALSHEQVVSLFKEGIDGYPVENESLVGWWPLNDSKLQALDLSGNNNTGTIVGNITWVTIPTEVNFQKISPVTFENISPAEYIVVTNATSPFYLVLNERFDENWVAYVNGEQSSAHLLFNDYANAWLINKTGKLTIKLYYLPESTVMPAYVVSVLAVLVLSLYIIRIRLFKRNSL